MAEWYYRLEEDVQGPLGEDEFKHIFQNGALPMTTEVWREGMKDWVEAGSIPTLTMSSTKQEKAIDHGRPAKHSTLFKLLYLGIGLAILIWAANSRNGSGGVSQSETVQQFRDQLIAQQNQWLAQSDNPIRKKIENAHMTVTAKGASVSSCSVQTIDGTENAGKNGSNVSEIDIIYTVTWDGWFQKDGYTEFEVDYDNQNRMVKNTKYLRSSALFNADTINWVEVGFFVGQAIAASADN